LVIGKMNVFLRAAGSTLLRVNQLRSIWQMLYGFSGSVLVTLFNKHRTTNRGMSHGNLNKIYYLYVVVKYADLTIGPCGDNGKVEVTGGCMGTYRKN
jgi:hypothetical protein